MSNTEPLTQVAVEREIVRISGLLEQETENLARHAMNHAKAESVYKVKNARERLRAGADAGGKLTTGDKDAIATIACEAELNQRLIQEAYHEVSTEKLRSLRAQLVALQTLAANIRNQT